MLKITVATGFLAALLTIPALADDMAKCDDAGMMKMDEMMKADTDPAHKEKVDMAMQEMDMAKTAMKAGKMDDCAMHMDSAMKQMK